MILNAYYKGEKLTNAKSRFDIPASTWDYDLFETLLLNKLKFNIGGLSFNYVPQPENFNGKKVDGIICKGSHSISKVIRPDINSPSSFGDINGTNDACIFIFNSDFKITGINTIEIFIARGAKNDKLQLWYLYIDGELSHEVEALRKKAVTKKVTGMD